MPRWPRLTANQASMLDFIRSQGGCFENDVQKQFSTKPSDWLTIRHRLESLQNRGLIRRTSRNGRPYCQPQKVSELKFQDA